MTLSREMTSTLPREMTSPLKEEQGATIMDDQPFVELVSPEERQFIAEMTLLLDLEDPPPYYILLRWLYATQFDVKAAAELYKESQVWRKYKGLEFMLNWTPPEVLRKYYPGGYSGWDKSGCPVWIIPLGKADLKGLLSSVTKQDFIDYTLRILETSLGLMKESTRLLGRPVYQHVFIFDMEGFSLRDATYTPLLEVVQSLISIYEGNYPETLKAAYVINTSRIFQLAFSIIQRTVNQKTLQKIRVFGQNNWKQVLLEEISPENLPEMWGGTKPSHPTSPTTSEDVLKMSTGGICMGGEVPLFYRTLHRGEDIQGIHSVNKQQIDQGAAFSVKLLFRSNCNLNWKFRVEGGEISFSVVRRRCCQRFRSNTTTDKQISLEPTLWAAESSSTLSTIVNLNIPDILVNKTKPATQVHNSPSPSTPNHMASVEETSKMPEIIVTSSPERNPKLPNGRSGNTNDEKVEIAEDEREDVLEVVVETDEAGDLVEDTSSPIEYVLPFTKYKNGKELSSGYLRCEGGYFYTLIFDNSESVFRGRKLYYSLNMEEDKKQEQSTESPDKELNSLSMSDLMGFVRELLEADRVKKTEDADHIDQMGRDEITA